MSRKKQIKRKKKIMGNKATVWSLGGIAIASILTASLVGYNYFKPSKQTNSLPSFVSVASSSKDIPRSNNSDSSEVDGFGIERSAEKTPKALTKTIKNLKIDLERTVEVYGSVGQNAVAASIQITLMNQENSEPIYLLLDSPGGGVLAGSRLISAMQSSKAPCLYSMS